MSLSLRSFLPSLDLGWNHVRAACSGPACHNKLLMRSAPGNSSGISVGDQWYCSADCFAAAARGTVSALAAGCVVEMPRNPRLSLGLALLAKGYVTEDQLRIAATKSRRRGENLEDTLIADEIVSEKQLAWARAAQWGYPVLGQNATRQTVEADLPATLLRAYSAAPFHYSVKARRLVLGFVTRVDHGLLESIEQITGLRAEPCFITPAEFDAQMERLKPASGYEEAFIEDPGDVARMAGTLGSFAFEVAARDVILARCKQWLWARIAGRRGVVDVIFALKDRAARRVNGDGAEIAEISAALG